MQIYEPDAGCDRRRQPDPQIAACIHLLAEMFPRCFAVHEARRRPLKIGIFDDLVAALDGAVTPAEVTRALRIYTANAVYRARLRAGTPRIDLNGEGAGAVTPAEEAHAHPQRNGGGRPA